ncbi:YraN family protein [Thermosynechococcaceae cyanobacterium Okahandja]
MHPIGEGGEAAVAAWLQARQWQIVARNWTCRWGELDLVAYHPVRGLAFVEVKTRRPRNWDANGLGALSPRKQLKLIRAAQAFLQAQPQWQDSPCRFDVALVLYQPSSVGGGYQVRQYLEDAFAVE